MGVCQFSDNNERTMEGFVFIVNYISYPLSTRAAYCRSIQLFGQRGAVHAQTNSTMMNQLLKAYFSASSNGQFEHAWFNDVCVYSTLRTACLVYPQSIYCLLGLSPVNRYRMCTHQ